MHQFFVFLVDMIDRLFGLLDTISFPFIDPLSGSTIVVTYGALVLGFIVTGFVVTVFWRGAKS